MRVLLDTCVWGGVSKALVAAGHDVVWVGDWPTDPGDEEILACARQESRVLVTHSTRISVRLRLSGGKRIAASCVSSHSRQRSR